MATFSLLSALGNGSERIASHSRFPLAAYQSGSVLVLWDYVKATGASQKFILLQPNQRCQALFFSRDALFVLGFWLSQQSHVMFTVWRVADGTKVAEHGLSDKVGGAQILVDYSPEMSQIVILHTGAAATATVVHWSGPEDRPQYVAHGHVSAPHGVLAVRLLEDGHHFTICSPAEVSFWSFVEQMPRQVLQVMLDKPLHSVALHDHFLYLVPQQGRVRVMNFAGQLEDYSIPPAAGGGSAPSSSSSYTAIAARGTCLCLGDEDGVLHLHDLVRMRPLRQVPPPEEIGSSSSSSFVSSLRAVRSISFGMNDDYLCVCFADGTYGVLHLDTGQYVSVRIGHRTAVRRVVMAPELQLPTGLASRLLDPERVLISRAIAFVTIAEDTNWITWPRRGAPARCSAFAFSKPPRVKDAMGLEVEVYIPRPVDEPVRRGTDADWLRGPPLVLTAVAFHPKACLSPTGDLGGAYRMIVGATDGCLHALESVEEEEAATQRLRWRTLKVREKARYQSEPDANRTLPPAWLQGVTPSSQPIQPSCCHISFSRCGRFVAASFSDGYAEMLHYPSLEQALVLSSGDPLDVSGTFRRSADVSAVHQAVDKSSYAKAIFAAHPLDEQKYDQNIYIISHTLEAQALVLFEVYPFGGDWSGSRYAKNSRAEFRLPVENSQSGLVASGQGVISDFAVHPSNLYLVVAASWPSLQRRPVILVFDLWSGDLLAQSPIFTSLLITPATPLQPTFCIDASGTYMFCASTPLVVGSMDDALEANRPFLADHTTQGFQGYGGPPMDSVAARSWQPIGGRLGSQEHTSSVVCVLEFASGRQVYQSSAEVTSIAVGSPGGDPAQLILGSADGSISVWHPPETVSQRIRDTLQACTKAYLQRNHRPGVEQLTPDELLHAVSWHWATYLGRSIEWKSWGEGPVGRDSGHGLSKPSDAWRPRDMSIKLSPQQQDWHDTGRLARTSLGARAKEDIDDVVVQARNQWLPAGKVVAHGVADRGGDVHAGFGRHPSSWAGVRATPAAPPRGSGSVVMEQDWAATAMSSPCLQRVQLGSSYPSPGFNGTGASWANSPMTPQVRPTPPYNGTGQTPYNGTGQTANGDAELVVSAPELHETFGTMPEHFEDPVPSGTDVDLPNWLVNGPTRRALQQLRPANAREEAQDFKVVESFFGDIDQFEQRHPDAQVLDSPRSEDGQRH